MIKEFAHASQWYGLKPLLCIVATSSAMFLFAMQLYAGSFSNPATTAVMLLAAGLAFSLCLYWTSCRIHVSKQILPLPLLPTTTGRKLPVVAIILLIIAVASVSYAGQLTVSRIIAGDRDIHTVSLWNIKLYQRESGSGNTISHVAGNTYRINVTSLPLFTSLQDSLAIPQISDLVILENGRALDLPHSWHHEISEFGEGRYSHFWRISTGEALVYFASTDNSNPATNGRTYEFHYRLVLHPVIIILLLTWVGMFLASHPVFAIPERFTKIYRMRPVRYGLFVLVALVFVYPLYLAWSQSTTSYQLIGGFLPWSDASGWNFSATRLLHTGELLDWSQRRPLNPAIQALFLRLTGEQLNLSLLLYTLLAAFSAAYMLISLRRSFGLIPSLLALVVLASFVDEFLPMTVTETPGFILGVAGFAVMWRSIGSRSSLLFAMGLAVFTAGMSARPGPMSIFPLLLIWATLARMDGRRISTKWAACALLGIGLGMFPNFLFGKLYGSGANLPGSNYAYTLYGLSLGGESWHSGYEVPSEGTVTEQQRTQLVYAAAFEQIRQNPKAFLIGAASFISNYLKYSHVYIDNPVIKILILLLLCTGFFVSLSRIKDPHYSFLTAGMLGIGVSAPLIFWAYDAYRAYIVSIGFDAALVAVGTGYTIRLVRTGILNLSAPENTMTGNPSVSIHLYACSAIMLFLIAGPILALSTFHPPEFSQPLSCGAGEHRAVLHTGGSSPYLEIVQPGNRSLVPAVPADRMAAIGDIHDFGLDTYLRAVQPGDMVIWGYNLLEPHMDKGFYFGRTDLMPVDGAYYQTCGEKIDLEESGTYWIVRINRATEVYPD